MIQKKFDIRGLEDYVMPAPEEEVHLETTSSEESEDEEWVTDNVVMLKNVSLKLILQDKGGKQHCLSICWF